MNGNRSIVYREFVGVTPVAKTLRNELRPVGHTQEHIIQNGLDWTKFINSKSRVKSRSVTPDNDLSIYSL